MRVFVTSLLILIAAGWIGTRICPEPLHGMAQEPSVGQWRRTTAGWERAARVVPHADAPRCPAIHPALVASLQILVSLFALVAATPG